MCYLTSGAILVWSDICLVCDTYTPPQVGAVQLVRGVVNTPICIHQRNSLPELEAKKTDATNILLVPHQSQLKIIRLAWKYWLFSLQV